MSKSEQSPYKLESLRRGVVSIAKRSLSEAHITDPGSIIRIDMEASPANLAEKSSERRELSHATCYWRLCGEPGRFSESSDLRQMGTMKDSDATPVERVRTAYPEILQDDFL